MNTFLMELQDVLKRVIKWSAEFQNGSRNYKFDVDNELYFLSEKFKVSFDKKELLLIYNLVDFYCDAIKHDFKNIDENYSVQEGQQDILQIINIMDLNNFRRLELPKELYKKLEDRFGL